MPLITQPPSAIQLIVLLLLANAPSANAKYSESNLHTLGDQHHDSLHHCSLIQYVSSANGLSRRDSRKILSLGGSFLHHFHSRLIPATFSLWVLRLRLVAPFIDVVGEERALLDEIFVRCAARVFKVLKQFFDLLLGLFRIPWDVGHG